MQISGLPTIAKKRSPLRIQRAVLFALVVRELRTRVEGRWLGLLWMVFEPLASLTLLLAIYGFRSHVASPNFELPVFLLVGILPYLMFRNLATRLPGGFAANRGLYAYRQVKPFDALMARVVVEVGLYSGVYIAALATLGWVGYHVLPVAPLELVGVSIVLLMLGTALGILFAVLSHNRPKVQRTYGMIFLPLYVLSGVLFPISFIPAQYHDWLLWNPVLHLIELTRLYFLPNYRVIEGVSLSFPALFVLVTMALALSLYRVDRDRLLSVE